LVHFVCFRESQQIKAVRGSNSGKRRWYGHTPGIQTPYSCIAVQPIIGTSMSGGRPMLVVRVWNMRCPFPYYRYPVSSSQASTLCYCHDNWTFPLPSFLNILLISDCSSCRYPLCLYS
jgi:hypothetical protein